MPKLTDTQSLLLAHAARAPFGSLYPLPDSHARGGTRVEKALAQLIAAGLADEHEVEAAGHAWREEGDLRFGLFVTHAGLQAIGIALAQEAASEQEAAPAAPRQIKAALVLSLLGRPEGAISRQGQPVRST